MHSFHQHDRHSPLHQLTHTQLALHETAVKTPHNAHSTEQARLHHCYTIHIYFPKRTNNTWKICRPGEILYGIGCLGIQGTGIGDWYRAGSSINGASVRAYTVPISSASSLAGKEKVKKRKEKLQARISLLRGAPRMMMQIIFNEHCTAIPANYGQKKGKKNRPTLIKGKYLALTVYFLIPRTFFVGAAWPPVTQRHDSTQTRQKLT